MSNNTIKFIQENGLEALTTQLGISVKRYPEEGLVVLNYSQIDSPKSHPVVMECRGLILNDSTLEVVCRPFNRFFNLGECPEVVGDINIQDCVVYDKVDGSLIKIYNYVGVWCIATRGTAFAESNVGGWDLTFHELVLKALNCTEEQFQHKCNILLSPDSTHLFEVTAMENRVVTRYEGYTLHYFTSRNNATGAYWNHGETLMKALGAVPVKSYSFNTLEDCMEAVKALQNLAEGYVLYRYGEPIAKVKSAAYVAVHHIRGEGLSPKRICQLILINEVDEYLTYFPEDEVHFTPYIETMEHITNLVNVHYTNIMHLESQKEFALIATTLPVSSLLFSMRRTGESFEKVWTDAKESYKLQLLLDMTKEHHG